MRRLAGKIPEKFIRHSLLWEWKGYKNFPQNYNLYVCNHEEGFRDWDCGCSAYSDCQSCNFSWECKGCKTLVQSGQQNYAAVWVELKK